MKPAAPPSSTPAPVEDVDKEADTRGVDGAAANPNLARAILLSSAGKYVMSAAWID